MKIAIVHDYIKEYGGAERVLESLHELFPDAPVYTTVYCPGFLGPHKKRFEDWDIRTSWLQNIPYRQKLISIFRLVAPFAFQSFDFSEFDVVIVSATGAYSPNIIKTKIVHTPPAIRHKPYHISYTHTPPRYLYGYATAREWKNNPLIRLIAETANYILRFVDYRSSQNVDQFIANSENVKQRIKKFYGKEAIVVYPPVDTRMLDVRSKDVRKENPKSKIQNLKSNYYLAGGRLARPKHIDLIIKAAQELGLELKIFGKGFAGYGDELHSLAYGKELMAKGKIEFVGEVSDEEKIELMRGAKAFIMASEDEDFGIVPVEAMGVGTPIIAYFSGGLKETVIDGKTGIFFKELTVESLVEAIKKFENTKISSADCVSQARKFSKENFMRKIKEVVEQYA